jgi:predicted outer membrane protein
MPRPLFNFELFKLGDYTAKNRGNWTEKEFEEIKRDFFTRKAEIKDFSGINIFVSKDPKDPHNKAQAVNLGKITDIYLEKGGVVSGNGYYYDDKKFTDIMSNLDGKSAGFIKPDGKGWSLDHAVITPADMAIIKDLKPNKESMFSFQDGEEVVYLEMKITDKEKKEMPKEILFAEHELKLKEALDAQKDTLTADFSDKIKTKETELKAEFSAMVEEKDGIIEQKDKTISDLKDANEKLKASVAEFAKNEKDAELKGLNERVDAIKGIDAEKKTALKTRVAEFANKAFDGYKEDIETILKGYEDLPPLVTEGKETGDPKEAGFSEDDLDKPLVIEIPSRASMKEKESGGK